MSKTNENTTLMLDRAASIVQGLTANWAVLKDNNAEEIIPRFQHSGKPLFISFENVLKVHAKISFDRLK